MFLFSRVHFKDHFFEGTPIGSIGSAYPSGWMTTDIFQLFLHDFVKHTRSTKHNAVCLLCDNHESHISVEGIILLKIVYLCMSWNTEMVGCTYPNSVTPANIQSGFRITCIRNFNGSVFTDDVFLTPRTDIKIEVNNLVHLVYILHLNIFSHSRKREINIKDW